MLLHRDLVSAKICLHLTEWKAAGGGGELCKHPVWKQDSRYNTWHLESGPVKGLSVILARSLQSTLISIKGLNICSLMLFIFTLTMWTAANSRAGPFHLAGFSQFFKLSIHVALNTRNNQSKVSYLQRGGVHYNDALESFARRHSFKIHSARNNRENELLHTCFSGIKRIVQPNN